MWKILSFFVFSFRPLHSFQTTGQSISSCLFLCKPFLSSPLLVRSQLVSEHLFCPICSWNPSCHCDISLLRKFLIHCLNQLVSIRLGTIQFLSHIIRTHHILIVRHIFILPSHSTMPLQLLYFCCVRFS